MFISFTVFALNVTKTAIDALFSALINHAGSDFVEKNLISRGAFGRMTSKSAFVLLADQAE